MKPAATSPSPNANSHTFTYDIPQSESDLNEQPCDSEHSYYTPEGTGEKVKLPADMTFAPAPTSGKRFLASSVIWHNTPYLPHSPNSQTDHPRYSVFLLTAPPLPPRPPFMRSMPEYLDLLSSPLLPPSSSQKSLSQLSPVPSPSEGNLPRRPKNNTHNGHHMLLNSLFLSLLTKYRPIRESCQGILMWSSSVWES